MTTLRTKQHDAGRVMTDVLRDDNGVIDLTNASGVKLIAANAATSVVKVNGAATITTAADGAVSYTFTAANLDTVGSFRFEWQITFTDGSIFTVPSRTYHRLVVIADVGS